MSDYKVYEALGWAHAYFCISLDNGVDPRTLEVPAMAAQAERDLGLNSTAPEQDWQQIAEEAETRLRELEARLTKMTEERDILRGRAVAAETAYNTAQTHIRKLEAERDEFITLAKDNTVICCQQQSHIQELKNALEALYAVQNGPPLNQYDTDWTTAMIEVERLLDIHEVIFLNEEEK